MCVWCVGRARGSAPLITHILGLSFALLVSEGVHVLSLHKHPISESA